MSSTHTALSIPPAKTRWSNKPITVTYQGQSRHLRELCRDKGQAFTTVWGRIKKGWGIEDAVETPSRLPNDTLVPHAGGYRKRSNSRKSFHIELAERALGKPLPPGAEVHHVNGIKHDNRPENLVICPDHAYHTLLHARQRAMDACGNPNYRKCEICGQWDDPELMYQRKSKSGQWHRACGSKTRTERKQRSKKK